MRSIVPLLLAAGLFCTAAHSVHAQPVRELRAVAYSGMHAPGTQAGVYFTDNPHAFGEFSPQINANGGVSFGGMLLGTGALSAFGIWSEASGTLELVARDGDQAVGFPDGAKYIVIGGRATGSTPAWPNSLGQVAFSAEVIDADANPSRKSAVWSEGSGSLQLVARQGDQAPGTTDGIHFGEFFVWPRLSDSGTTAFEGSLTGPDIDDGDEWGIWSDRPGSLELIARTGAQAPGLPSGFTFYDFHTLQIDGAGRVAFQASANGHNVVAHGIWSERTGSLAPVVQRGDPAPGTPDGVAFRSFSRIQIDPVSRLAFGAELSGPGVNETNDRGIWSEGSGSLQLVAREGDQAPGLPAGITFNNFGQDLLPTAERNSWETAFSSAGKTAFRATLTGIGVDETNDSGIWSEGLGELRLVAREGDPAPGAPDGAVFRSFESLPQLNARGQTAFWGSYAVGDGFLRDGIWAEDVAGVLHPIALEGDLVEVTPGNYRPIESLNPISGSFRSFYYPTISFNDRGELALVAHTAHTEIELGDTVLVSSAVAIPEPAAALLALLGAAGLLAVARPPRRTAHSPQVAAHG